MAAKIPLSRVYQSEKIDRRILDVVHGGNYILGPESKAFEQELAAWFGVKHVVLSSSWTAAVHLLHLAQRLFSAGQITVDNEFDPKIKYVFRDWRSDLGTMNFYRGIAMSSDVYMYYLAGGYIQGGRTVFQGMGEDKLASCKMSVMIFDISW